MLYPLYSSDILYPQLFYWLLLY